MDRYLDRSLTLTAGIALGAGGAYLLDARLGPRRRALLRDKAGHYLKVTVNGLERRAADLTGRSHALWPTLRRWLTRDRVADETLVERVRARMGHIVTHPGSVVVEAEDGVVTLRGPILSEEMREFVNQTRKVPGVRQVVAFLEPHEAPGELPEARRGLGRRAKRSARGLVPPDLSTH